MWDGITYPIPNFNSANKLASEIEMVYHSRVVIVDGYQDSSSNNGHQADMPYCLFFSFPPSQQSAIEKMDTARAISDADFERQILTIKEVSKEKDTALEKVRIPWNL